MPKKSSASLQIERILASTVPDALKELTTAIKTLDETMQEHKSLNEMLYKDLSEQMQGISRRLGTTATQQSVDEIRKEIAQDRALAQKRFETIIAKLD